MDVALETVWRPRLPVDVRQTLAPLRRGSADPTYRRDGVALWRTSRTAHGPVTCRLVQDGLHEVRCTAWGPGAEAALAGLADLLGGRDDPVGFEPAHPVVRDALRRHPGLRVPRTGQVLEALVPAVLEQKVTGMQARSSWRWLLHRHGELAPGPAPAGMRVPPSAAGWRAVPSWDWHRAGVEPRQSRTVVTAAAVAGRLEETVDMPRSAAAARLSALPGIGAWTVAEVAQRALGDADAVSVGDYHLAAFVGWALAGHPLDDDGMIELLAPWRPHRYRVIRLLEAAGRAAPRFGARLTIQDHRPH